jgi:hypothetical protein
MLSDDVLGDHRAAVVLIAQHDDVDVELFRPLEDDVRDVVLGRRHHFAMDRDARGGELVDRVLDDLPLAHLGVVLGRPDAHARARADVGGDDVASRDVQEMHRSTGHFRELSRTLQRIVGRVRGRIYSYKNAIVHSSSSYYGSGIRDVPAGHEDVGRAVVAVVDGRDGSIGVE